MENLGRKMAKGAVWTVLLRITRRVIGLVSTVILARLLVPEDFGLVAMAMSIIAVLELLSAFSFDVALIQNQDARREHYDTAWTFNVIFLVCSALILLLLAEPAARFYEEPRLEAVMYLLALGTFIQGLENIGVVAFQKELEFNKEFTFTLAKATAGFIVTVSLAFVFHNYWALVAGTLFSKFTGVAVSYLIHPFRPRFSLAARHDLFHFSKWLLLNNILFFLNARSSDFIIAKIAGPHALGLFNVGYEISTLPSAELIAPINRAVFPGYAKMSKDTCILRQGFLKVISIIVLFVLPAGAGVAAIAGPLVRVVLGNNWLEIIPVIQLLGIYGILTGLQSNTSYIFLALGKPKILTVLVGAQVMLKIPLLVLGISHSGVIGAAWAFLATEALVVPFFYLQVLRMLGLRIAPIGTAIWRPLVATLVMIFIVNSWQRAWIAPINIQGQIVQLFELALVGAVSYVFAMTTLWRLSLKPDGAEKLILEKARNLWLSILLTLKVEK